MDCRGYWPEVVAKVKRSAGRTPGPRVVGEHGGVLSMAARAGWKSPQKQGRNETGDPIPSLLPRTGARSPLRARACLGEDRPDLTRPGKWGIMSPGGLWRNLPRESVREMIFHNYFTCFGNTVCHVQNPVVVVLRCNILRHLTYVHSCPETHRTDPIRIPHASYIRPPTQQTYSNPPFPFQSASHSIGRLHLV